MGTARRTGVLAGVTPTSAPRMWWAGIARPSASWSRVITLPHWDRDRDVLWMIVRRTVGGVTVRYVEYVERYR